MVAAVAAVHSKRQPTPALFSPQKHRASKARKNVMAVAQAVMKVMAQELGERARMRWPALIDDELGETLFGGLSAKPPKSCRAAAPHKPSGETGVVGAWTPSKPKLTVLLLKAFGSGDELLASDDKPIVLNAPMSLRTDQHCKCVALSKLVARRATEWLKCHHRDALEASGEIPPEQLQCATRVNRTLARVASDTLAYLSVVALEGQHGGDADDVVLELHTTDQRLMGMSTRGCGIVFNAHGRVLFESAVAKALAHLEDASIDARMRTAADGSTDGSTGTREVLEP